MTARPEVLVVGAGITGLALAVGLRDAGRAVRLLDARAAPGGNFRTARESTAEGTWLLEVGPNSFGDADPDFAALVRRAGLADRLVAASSEANRRWLFRDGRLVEVPSHPLRFLSSPLLPLGGRLRLLREPFVRPRPAGAPEETLAAFCDRRLGRSAREKLLTPVVGGIYAGDPEELGAESAFPRMVALEREHGSLIRAAMRGKGPPSRGRLSSFRDGLEELPRALGAELGEGLRLGTSVERVERTGEGFRVTTSEGEVLCPSRLVLAVTAPDAARLLAGVDPSLAGELGAIGYAPMAVVHVGVAADRVALPPGFGFLVPRGEGLRILGAIQSSRLFPGRAPAGHELLTVFAGGRLDPDAVALPDGELARRVLEDLQRAVALRGGPALLRITRWERAIPQYVVGHAARVARIRALAATVPGLHLVGNWQGGIAMPDCVRSARALVAELSTSPPSAGVRT